MTRRQLQHMSAGQWTLSITIVRTSGQFDAIFGIVFGWKKLPSHVFQVNKQYDQCATASESSSPDPDTKGTLEKSLVLILL